MADAPFDQTPIGVRERPVSGDHNQQDSQVYRSIREVERARMSPRTSFSSSASAGKSVLISDGFRVVPRSPTAMSVQVSPGIGFFFDPIDLPTNLGAPDLEQVNDLSPYKPVVLQAPVLFAVPAAPGPGLGRTDIIEARIDHHFENAVVRKQLDVGSEEFLDHAFFKSVSFALDGRTGVIAPGGGNSTAGISYKVGTAAATGAGTLRRDSVSIIAPPSTSPGYIKLAEIQANNGTTAITFAEIVDRRPLAGTSGLVHISASWRLQWNSGTPIVTMLTCSCPPGISVVLAPNAAVGRSAGSIFIVGGELVTVTPVVNVSYINGTGFPDQFPIGFSHGPSFTPIAALGSICTTMDAASPPVVVGGSSKVFLVQFIGKYVTNAGTVNVTDTSLEDAVITMTATLTY